MNDNVTTLLNFLPQLWEGVQTTIILTVVGSIGAVLIALILGLTMTSPSAWLRVPARIVVEFFRGTSLLCSCSGCSTCFRSSASTSIP